MSIPRPSSSSPLDEDQTGRANRDLDLSSVRLVRGRHGFRQAADLWNSIEEAASGTPFQSYAWATAWLRHIAPDVEPWLLMVGDPPHAIAPLALSARRGLRRLVLIGHGVSDYLDLITSSPRRAVYDAVLARLERERGNFDLLHLHSLPDHLDQWPTLRSSTTCPVVDRDYDVCPVIDTTGEWETYLARAPRHLRSTLRSNVRRSSRASSSETRIEEFTNRLFDELVEVERASWKWAGGRSYLRSPRRRRFLEAVLQRRSREHEIWVHRRDGALAAFAVVFHRGRNRYYYLPSFRADLSGSGSLLLAAIVEASFRDHVGQLDLLQGDEPYKSSWATGRRVVREVAVGTGSLRGSVATATLRLRWLLARSSRLRAVRQRLLTVSGPFSKLQQHR